MKYVDPVDSPGSVDPIDLNGVPPVAPEEKSTTIRVVVAVLVIIAIAIVSHYMSAAPVVG